MIGRLAHMVPASFGDNATLKQCEMALDSSIADSDICLPEEVERITAADLRTRFAGFLRRYLHGRSFFQASEGLFGVCPRDAKVEDQVAVVLGCEAPLILRPIMSDGKSGFQVIGESYVPGMMCAESLLGELPQGWKTITLGQLGLGCTVYSRHGKITQQDPRVKLPPDWRYRYGTFEDPQETEPLVHGIEEKKTRQ
jgi:hypothetical protein